MNQPLKFYPLDIDYRNIDFREARVLPWVAINGDESLRLNYSLNTTSIVYDIGGYRGDWAKEILRLYGCSIKIYEPVDTFVNILKDLFKSKQGIEIYPFGLGGNDRDELIGVDMEASSVFKPGDQTQKIKICDVSVAVGKNSVDLMKMNIEGGEYELLERLIETGQVSQIKNFQIQFHDFVPSAITKRKKIQKELSKTHSLTYNYPFIWENWELR